MPFPESERIVFEENTLDEVICQLRFPPILEIASELPAGFQNLIRAEYPLYRSEDPFAGVPAQLSQVIAELPIPRPQQAITHHFDTADEARTVSLAPEFVALTQRDYTEWAVFVGELERAESALAETYQPAFYSRIGLRYRDVVKKVNLGLEDTPWRELLNPAFTGLLAAEPIHDELQFIRGECIVACTPGPESYVKINHGFIGPEDDQTYVIDMDFFTTERSESDRVRDILNDFNRQAGNLFRWAILPPLRDALRPRPLAA